MKDKRISIDNTETERFVISFNSKDEGELISLLIEWKNSLDVWVVVVRGY